MEKTSEELTPPMRPDWNFWLHLEETRIWEGVALTLNLEPNEIHFEPVGVPMRTGDLYDGIDCGTVPEEPVNLPKNALTEYAKRLELATRNFKLTEDDSVPLKLLIEKAKAWAWDMPDELYAGKPAPRPKREVKWSDPAPSFTEVAAPVDVSILRIKDVMKKTALSKSAIYAKRKDGAFPPGQKLGGRAQGWTVSEVEDWLLQQRGKTDLDN